MNLVFYFYVKCYKILCECDIIFDINHDVWIKAKYFYVTVFHKGI